MTTRLARVAVALAGLGVALAAVEGALRLAIGHLPVPALIFMHRDLKDRHPVVYARLREVVPNLNRRQEEMELGWTFRPSTQVTGINEDGEPYDRTSSPEGFFTPDTPAPSVPQIVTLGDSFLSTFVVPKPIAWVMRDQLNQPVYNLSVGGWGPESYRAAYEKFGRHRAHSQVVVFTFINDITDVANWQAWQAEELTGMSFLTWIQRANPDGERINTSDAWLDRRSLAWNLIRLLSWRAPQTARATAGPSGDDAPAESFTARNGETFALQFIDGLPFTTFDPGAFEPGGSYYVYLQSYFESLERLRRTIQSTGASMTLVWIPSKERVYFPLLADERLARHVTNTTKDLGSLERIMARYARQVGVPFVDLTPSLEAAARDGQRLYFAVDGHLNSAGNELVGRLVANHLKQPAAPADTTLDQREPLPFRSGVLPVQEVMRLEDSLLKSSLVTARSAGWSVRGLAESQYGYLLQWPDRDVARPAFVTVRGRIRRGGFTIGLLENNQWATTFNVTSRGRFDIAVPITKTGRYVLTLANCLVADDLRTDFDIDEIGWTPINSEAPSR